MKMGMGDYFHTGDHTNQQVLDRATDDVSTSAAQVARKLHRRDRKINSGTPAPARPGAPWYRRFEKR